LGKTDLLRGFKENVIMGHLIPAGTGFLRNREMKVHEEIDLRKSDGLDSIEDEADSLLDAICADGRN
jgi:hypothetical protein